ncbi:MAG: hypothetical protein A2076_18365 [Geobacteraceae bacterium GWC2_53_11]|nr:MAG: hypothetical protein A2076_18365 [Geobacteraceae bacterium GWC2_53_11]
MNSTKYVRIDLSGADFFAGHLKNRMVHHTPLSQESTSYKEVKSWPIQLLMIAQTVQHVRTPVLLTLSASKVQNVLSTPIPVSTAEHALIPAP